MLGRSLLASLGLATGLVAPAFADCALWGLEAKPLTPPGTAIPQDGGIVVGAVPEPSGKLEPGDVALQVRWRIGGAKPTLVSLAPGLAVMRVPPGKGAVVDASGKPVIEVKTTGTKRQPLTAPKVSAIVYEKRARRRSMERVLVTLDDVPKTAIAIVLSDAKGTPRSWQPIKQPTDGKAVAAYLQTDCQALPNGTVPSRAGDVVTVQLVDELGRVSAATRPLKIAAAPDP
jgi:hypothetical protein